MRKIALVKEDHGEIKRLMIHDCGHGVYVFNYNTLKDAGGLSDNWYESVKDAEADCLHEYGVKPDEWVYIDDPLPDCQQDWINPIRLKGRNPGQPEWGKFERLVDGVWVEFNPEIRGLE